MKKIVVDTEVEEGAELPQYSTENAAGADVYAHIEEEIVLPPSLRRTC